MPVLFGTLLWKDVCMIPQKLFSGSRIRYGAAYFS